MSHTPTTQDLIDLVRNADEHDIRDRLEQLSGEQQALKTLLRSVQARNRMMSVKPKAGASDA